MKINSESIAKYDGRMTRRRIQDAMIRLFGLETSPATVLDLTRRAAYAIHPEYNAILNKIRGAPIVYVDETSIRVQGERHWIWTFPTPSESFFRDSEEPKHEGSDGSFNTEIQRYNRVRWLETLCHVHKSHSAMLAHLLRESKDIAEKFEEAIPLHSALKELYEILAEALENDPPPKVRKNLWQLAREALRHRIKKEASIEKVRKFIGKIYNGFDWFTLSLIRV